MYAGKLFHGSMRPLIKYRHPCLATENVSLLLKAEKTRIKKSFLDDSLKKKCFPKDKRGKKRQEQKPKHSKKIGFKR